MFTKVIYLLILIFCGFVLNIAVIPQILKIVKGKKIFDIPGGRKIHKNITPSMGGIGVFFSFILIAMLTVHDTEGFEAQYYYFSFILLFFTGLRDDLLPVKSVYKLFIQCLSGFILAGFANIRFKSLYSLSFLYDNPFPEWFAFAITIFVIVFLINAYNLIDGIDGLAGTNALILLGFLIIWFSVNQVWTHAFLCSIMFGAIMGFIYYNWSPAKIFMGDTGSLIIGFFCVSMAIVFVNINETATYKISNSASLITVLFIYPIFDIIRITYIRLKRKTSPFSPDKRHVHLILKRIGFSHREITTIISLWSIFNIFLVLYLGYLGVPELLIILTVVLICYLFSSLLNRRIKYFQKEKKLIEVKNVLKKNR